MASTVLRSSSFEKRIERYLVRRGWPIGASAVFVVCGLLYFFRWSAIVRHRPSMWITPLDLWTTYGASSAAAHGHFASIYGSGFLAIPGFLAVLAPIGALSGHFSTIFVQVTNHGRPFTGSHYYVFPGTKIVLSNSEIHGGNLYAVHPGVFALLGTYVLLISCTALFAFDAMAEYLEVARWRRAVLSVAEAALLWVVVVVAGHPEDVLAVTLVTWALLWAFQDRWAGAGWFFGAALAVQPLVIVVFPLLLVLGGRHRTLGLLVRGVVPAVAVTVGPLVADPHAVVHALVDQPTFPNLPFNHKTLWTPLAPHLGGTGINKTVGGGPLRLVALALSAGIGWWSLRWRQRHEMIVWGAALALALRTYTESVMTAYYVWPALAVGILIAARASTRRFVIALVAAVVALVVGIWQINPYVWWAVQMAAVTVILVAAASPLPPEVPVAPAKRRPPAGSKARPSGSATKKKQPARR